MTLPMPGPNDVPGHEGKDWLYACTTCSGLYDRGDAEVAAQFWNATACAQFIAWEPNDMLGIDVPADGQLYEATRPDPGPAWTEAETWHRLATHPHDSEGDHT